jgi:hypothetical protein
MCGRAPSTVTSSSRSILSPLGQIRKRAGIPPQGNAPRFLTLRRLAAQSGVRPGAVHVHIVEPQRSNLGNAQSAATREPHDDQIALGVQRSIGLSPGVGEYRR